MSEVTEAVLRVQPNTKPSNWRYASQPPTTLEYVCWLLKKQARQRN